MALPTALFAIRSAKFTRTGFSPFEFKTASRPKLNSPLDVRSDDNPASYVEFAAQVKANLSQLTKFAAEQTNYYADRVQTQLDNIASPHPFKVGDLVGVSRVTNTNAADQLFDGPFKIIEIAGPSSAFVDTPKGAVRYNVDRFKVFPGTLPTIELRRSHSSESIESNWIEPPKDLTPQRLLFKRVRVYWPPEKKWYTGTVKSLYRGVPRVLYDDGEERSETFFYKRHVPYTVLASDFISSSPSQQ
jgi:hypothetical protein